MSSASSSSAESKCHQIVLEAIYKSVECILESRIDPDLLKLTKASSKSKRARFNFDIPKLSDVRHDMRAWERNIHQPLCVEILWNNKSDDETASHSEHTLVESWRIMYSPSRQPIDATTAITNLRQIYKEFTILLRSLYCIVRALPAHQTLRALQQKDDSSLKGRLYGSETKAKQHSQVYLSYRILVSSPERPSPYASRFKTSHLEEFALPAVPTPFGNFHITSVYSSAPPVNSRRAVGASRRRETLSSIPQAAALVAQAHLAGRTSRDPDTTGGSGGGGGGADEGNSSERLTASQTSADTSTAAAGNMAIRLMEDYVHVDTSGTPSPTAEAATTAPSQLQPTAMVGHGSGWAQIAASATASQQAAGSTMSSSGLQTSGSTAESHSSGSSDTHGRVGGWGVIATTTAPLPIRTKSAAPAGATHSRGGWAAHALAQSVAHTEATTDGSARSRERQGIAAHAPRKDRTQSFDVPPHTYGDTVAGSFGTGWGESSLGRTPPLHPTARSRRTDSSDPAAGPVAGWWTMDAPAGATVGCEPAGASTAADAVSLSGSKYSPHSLPHSMLMGSSPPHHGSTQTGSVVPGSLDSERSAASASIDSQRRQRWGADGHSGHSPLSSGAAIPGPTTGSFSSAGNAFPSWMRTAHPHLDERQVQPAAERRDSLPGSKTPPSGPRMAHLRVWGSRGGAMGPDTPPFAPTPAAGSGPDAAMTDADFGGAQQRVFSFARNTRARRSVSDATSPSDSQGWAPPVQEERRRLNSGLSDGSRSARTHSDTDNRMAELMEVMDLMAPDMDAPSSGQGGQAIQQPLQRSPASRRADSIPPSYTKTPQLQASTAQLDLSMADFSLGPGTHRDDPQPSPHEPTASAPAQPGTILEALEHRNAQSRSTASAGEGPAMQAAPGSGAEAPAWAVADVGASTRLTSSILGTGWGLVPITEIYEPDDDVDSDKDTSSATAPSPLPAGSSTSHTPSHTVRRASSAISDTSTGDSDADGKQGVWLGASKPLMWGRFRLNALDLAAAASEPHSQARVLDLALRPGQLQESLHGVLYESPDHTATTRFAPNWSAQAQRSARDHSDLSTDTGSGPEERRLRGADIAMDGQPPFARCEDSESKDPDTQATLEALQQLLGAVRTAADIQAPAASIPTRPTVATAVESTRLTGHDSHSTSDSSDSDSDTDESGAEDCGLELEFADAFADVDSQPARRTRRHKRLPARRQPCSVPAAAPIAGLETIMQQLSLHRQFAQRLVL